MGFFSDLADKVHVSEQCQYMGGHPSISRACKGILTVNNDKIIFKGGMLSKFEIPIQDIISTSMQTQEQISRNVTLTRLLFMGVFAFGMKKKTVDKTKYLVVSYEENTLQNSIVFESNYIDSLSSSIMKARQVYIKKHPEVETRAEAETEQIENTQPVDDIPSQIKKLADLKDAGILTEEEFTQKKTELLAKM